MTTGMGRSDTVAVVGSVAGIGAATVRRLAMGGHHVIWRSAFDDGPSPAVDLGPARPGTVVDTHTGGRY